MRILTAAVKTEKLLIANLRTVLKNSQTKAKNKKKMYVNRIIHLHVLVFTDDVYLFIFIYNNNYNNEINIVFLIM